MRVIYGKKDRPDKSHILIIRGVSDESLNYFKHHVDKYPTWGLVLCLDEDQKPATIYWSEEYGPGKVSETPIHKIWCSLGDAPDDYVIHEVLREFPEYDEDSDPIIEESKKKSVGSDLKTPADDFLDSMSMAAKSMRGLGEAMGRFGERLLSDRDRYKEMFGVYPGERMRPDTNMPVKVMQFTHEMSGMELRRYIDIDMERSTRGVPTEDISARLPPELVRRMKYKLIESIIECENFWDIKCIECASMDRPYPNVQMVVRMAIAPMGDIAKDRPCVSGEMSMRLEPRPHYGSFPYVLHPEEMEIKIPMDERLREELEKFGSPSVTLKADVAKTTVSTHSETKKTLEK